MRQCLGLRTRLPCWRDEGHRHRGPWPRVAPCFDCLYLYNERIEEAEEEEEEEEENVRWEEKQGGWKGKDGIFIRLSVYRQIHVQICGRDS